MKSLLPLLFISLTSCAPALSAQEQSDLRSAHLQIHEYAAQQGDNAENSLNIGLTRLAVIPTRLKGDTQGAQAAIMRPFAYLLNCDNTNQTSEGFARTLSRQMTVASRMQEIASGTPALKRGQKLAQRWNEHAFTLEPNIFTSCEELITIRSGAQRW